MHRRSVISHSRISSTSGRPEGTLTTAPVSTPTAPSSIRPTTVSAHSRQVRHFPEIPGSRPTSNPRAPECRHPPGSSLLPAFWVPCRWGLQEWMIRPHPIPTCYPKAGSPFSSLPIPTRLPLRHGTQDPFWQDSTTPVGPSPTRSCPIISCWISSGCLLWIPARSVTRSRRPAR